MQIVIFNSQFSTRLAEQGEAGFQLIFNDQFAFLFEYPIIIVKIVLYIYKSVL